MAPEAYIHGYASEEQERLIAQAAHWRDDLILAGTKLEPGTRLLEVGCGVGAVLAVLGQAFPGIELSGVDIEQRQVDYGRRYLASLGLEADLRQADGMALPFADGSFDHVWMMWFLEHLDDPVAALREARRVLVPGGRFTAIEVDYGTIEVHPTTPAVDALVAALILGMEAGGRSDAGSHVAGWLAEAGFEVTDPGERICSHTGDEVIRQGTYFAEIWEGAIPSLLGLPGAPAEDMLRRGLDDVRRLYNEPGARLEWVVHKSEARR